MPYEDAHPFLFLSANPPWVYALAEALAHDAPAHAVRLYDWKTYWYGNPSWPDSDSRAEIERTLRVLPTGYAGMFEWVARPFMRLMINRWRSRLRARTGREPYVVVPYPYLAPWVRSVPEERLVYYNLDAYTRYRPERAEQIQKREKELVHRAVRTICLAQHQVNTLRDRHPAHADRVQHFPLGVVDDFLNSSPADPPVPKTVTYVGNMSDRVDWEFVEAVTGKATDLQFRFVGGIEAAKAGLDSPEWKTVRSRVLERSNVEVVGRIPQEEVPKYYSNSCVNWIPYDPEHPFNVASCPTKIMDGLASGRPLVSTPVPECELYPEWIDVAQTPDEMATLLRRRSRKFMPDRARHQVEKTRKHTWPHRADTLRTMLASERRSSSVK